MLKSLFDSVMERRAAQLIAEMDEWLPAEGPVLDVGSGTGHVGVRLERERGIEVIGADVTDLHVVGRAPVVIGDGALPFDAATFNAALLFFMLHYPRDPASLLAEAARVTRGPILIVQSLYSNPFGYVWLRAREFVWTSVAFHVSRLIGYVPADARFTMGARRFYTARALRRDLESAGLRIRAVRERPVLPARSLVVAGWVVERDE